MMTGQITATIEARDLEAIDNIIYEPKTEELTARSVFPQKYDVNEGAESYSYDVMTRSGAAKVIANGADDLPLVDVDMVRKSVPIYSIGVGLSYTVQDLRAARMQGTTVDTAKAATVRRAIAEKENSIAFRGEKNMLSKAHLKRQAFKLILHLLLVREALLAGLKKQLNKSLMKSEKRIQKSPYFRVTAQLHLNYAYHLSNTN